MSNAAIWDALGKTDPAHTKQFSRPGGFKGTSLKPQWAYKKLTEQFGPVGIGWGMNRPQFDLVHQPEGEVIVYCTAECWHTDRSNLFYGVGGDKVVASTKHGLRADDEAFKKAHTDAVMNAFKLAGVGADIHLGQFDDDKYVAAMEREFSQPVATITEAQCEELIDLCEGLKFPVARVLTIKRINDLRELPAESFEGAKAWVMEQSKKEAA